MRSSCVGECAVGGLLPWPCINERAIAKNAGTSSLSGDRDDRAVRVLCPDGLPDSARRFTSRSKKGRADRWPRSAGAVLRQAT